MNTKEKQKAEQHRFETQVIVFFCFVFLIYLSGANYSKYFQLFTMSENSGNAAANLLEQRTTDLREIFPFFVCFVFAVQ